MKRRILIILACGLIPMYADDIAEIPATEKAFIAAEETKMRAAGLDAKPIYNKVREGVAKGVSGEALRKAVTRERELFVEAARLLKSVATSGSVSKTEVAKSIVIATKRGAQTNDIQNAVSLGGKDAGALVGVIDLLGDFARSGIFGEKAVRAAIESSGRKGGIASAQDRVEGRADQNRSILQREAQQNLPSNRPAISISDPRSPPTGTQGEKH